MTNAPWLKTQPSASCSSHTNEYPPATSSQFGVEPSSTLRLGTTGVNARCEPESLTTERGTFTWGWLRPPWSGTLGLRASPFRQRLFAIRA